MEDYRDQAINWGTALIPSTIVYSISNIDTIKQKRVLEVILWAIILIVECVGIMNHVILKNQQYTVVLSCRVVWHMLMGVTSLFPTATYSVWDKYGQIVFYSTELVIFLILLKIYFDKDT